MTTGTVILVVVGIAAALCVIMSAAWMVQQHTGNSGWVDTIWTFGLGTISIACALAPLHSLDWPTPRQLLTVALVLAWSLRLGLHIARRTTGISDDPRYAELARQWGDDAPWQMFWLLQKQAVVTIPLALAIFVAAQNPVAALRWQDILATAVLVVAIGSEALADHQLCAFRANARNKRRVCDVGLWSWSRHPNYFFEWFGWLAYPLLAIDSAGNYPWGWLALLAPVCMYWILVHVSGIPPLEKHMAKSRGAAFLAYQARTSAFFPLPPTRNS